MSYQDMAAKALKNGEVENLTPTYVEWTEMDQTIVGRFKGKIEIDSSLNEGFYFQYMFDTDAGLIKFHLGKSTDSEAGGLFLCGQVYSITYRGSLALKGGKTVNKFNIHRVISNGEDGA